MRHWSVTPSPTGMQITGTDLGPADLFMLGDWINQVRAYAAAAQYKGNQE